MRERTPEVSAQPEADHALDRCIARGDQLHTLPVLEPPERTERLCLIRGGGDLKGAALLFLGLAESANQ